MLVAMRILTHLAAHPRATRLSASVELRAFSPSKGSPEFLVGGKPSSLILTALEGSAPEIEGALT